MVAELISGIVGLSGVAGTIYGTWAIRKSKRMQSIEESGEMIDNADKIVTMWEKLSANYITELRDLKGEYKEMNQKYNDLRIEFEVEKRQSGFLIEQYKLQLSQKDAEIATLKTENNFLRDQLGTGVIKPLHA